MVCVRVTVDICQLDYALMRLESNNCNAKSSVLKITLSKMSIFYISRFWAVRY
jgi:hypothetical protein